MVVEREKGGSWFGGRRRKRKAWERESLDVGREKKAESDSLTNEARKMEVWT